jgi:uncharacterized protein (TIGR03083 family)
VTPSDYVGLLREDGETLARTAADGLDRHVPSCPGWTVTDLVAHTGRVHRDKIQIIRRGGTERFEREQVAVPSGAAIIDWYREGLSELADLLAASDPEQPAWSWAGDHRVRFWQRRMAHETAIHRWDAQLAVGAPAPIAPADFAADGVSEFLDAHLPSQLEDGPYDGPPGSVHAHATDADGEWLVRLVPPMLEMSREHAKADVAVRGPASDLDLVLWKRVPPETVEVLGDAATLRGFLDWIDNS